MLPVSASTALARLPSSFAYFQRITASLTGARNFELSRSPAKPRMKSSAPSG
jgi:hypothetical protein